MTRSRGFTMMELVVSMLILAMVLALVAHTAHWSMLERGQARARQAALETATNLLETARALSWEELTPEWAALQKLSTAGADLLPPGSRTEVRIETEKTTPRTKRVTVRVFIATLTAQPEMSMELAALFSARTAPPKEEK